MAKVLIVDDDKDISELIQLILKKEQIDSVIVNDPLKTFDILKENNFDLILLDIMMPNISGTELCTKIRDEVSCPVVFLSAKSELLDKMSGYEVGGDDYITKPFDNTELILKVKSHLRLNKRSNNMNKGNTIKIGDIILESYPYTLENSERLLCEKLDAAMEYPGEMEDYLAELDKENYDLVGYMISQDIFGEVWGKV